MSENPEGTISMDDAIGLLIPEDQEAEETEADPESDEDTPETAEDSEVGDDEGEDTDDEGEGPEDDDPEFEIETPKGKQRVTLSELRAGYMRQADYTRKTMDVSEKRRDVERREAEIAQLKDELSERLQVLAVNTDPEPNWMELAQKLDPREFNAARVQWEQRQRQRDMARQEWQQLQAHERSQTIAKEQEALFEVFPEWREPARFQEVARKLTSGAETYGFAADEIAGMVDHRFVRVLNDAIAYRELMAKEPAAKKVVKPKPGLKPGAKPNRKVQQEARSQQLRERLKQTGDIHTAAEFLLTG